MNKNNILRTLVASDRVVRPACKGGLMAVGLYAIASIFFPEVASVVRAAVTLGGM